MIITARPISHDTIHVSVTKYNSTQVHIVRHITDPEFSDRHDATTIEANGKDWHVDGVAAWSDKILAAHIAANL